MRNTGYGKFWRAHRFADYKFRRQVPLDFYIADFVCFANG